VVPSKPIREGGISLEEIKKEWSFKGPLFRRDRIGK
jgi:hypothetical protein